MVLFAIMIPLFLGLGAIVIDVGHWFVVRKTAQDAADAAALAAARELASCDDPGCPAYEVAEDYVHVNMPEAGFEVETPYTPTDGPGAGTADPTKVEVTVTHPAGTFFGRAFDIFDVTVSRRAVAQKFEIPGNLAIFSYQHPLCSDGSGLLFNGDNMSINGLVHSNGAFQINGKDFWAADGTIQRNNCVADLDDPPTSQFGDDPTATEPRDLWPPPGHQPWPVWHKPADFGWLDDCDYWGQKITINSTELKIDNPNSTTAIVGGVIPTGTYCATETFQISGDNLKGTFTAVAREITVSGTKHDFTHYKDRTLFFAVPNWNLNPDDDGTAPFYTDVNCQNDKEMHLNAHEYHWSGTIFSPCTKVVINGDDLSTLEGTIVGYQVTVNGANFNMLGKSEVPVQIELNLVE